MKKIPFLLSIIGLIISPFITSQSVNTTNLHNTQNVNILNIRTDVDDTVLPWLK